MIATEPQSERYFFNIRRESAGGVAVVVVTGAVDLVTAPRVGGSICAASGGRDVVVDLRDVEFRDASGVEELRVGSDAADGGLHLVCVPGGSVERLLERAGVRQAFDVHPSREAALEAARRRAGVE